MEVYQHLSGFVPYATRRKWFFFFPIDGDGMPTSDAAYDLVRYLFANHDQAYFPDALAERLTLHPELVHCMCRQLEIVDLVQQAPPGSRQYRYALDSRNTVLQGKLEVALLDYPLRATHPKRPPAPPA